MTDALLPLLRPTDLIWIHDYHLMAMPAFLRARGVDAPIGFFLHIPFPSPDMLASVPEAGALIRDLLSADLLGFQTANDVENFAAAATASPAPRACQAITACSSAAAASAWPPFPVEIEAREFAATAAAAWRTPGQRAPAPQPARPEPDPGHRPHGPHQGPDAAPGRFPPPAGNASRTGATASPCCRSPPNPQGGLGLPRPAPVDRPRSRRHQQRMGRAGLDAACAWSPVAARVRPSPATCAAPGWAWSRRCGTA